VKKSRFIVGHDPKTGKPIRLRWIHPGVRGSDPKLPESRRQWLDEFKRSVIESSRAGDEPIVAVYVDDLALLWQIITNGKVIGFPNQFFNDSWVVG
jgi:hypothetical protein